MAPTIPVTLATGSSGAGPRSGGRARRFARLWALTDASIDEQISPAKDALFADMPPRVVEIGPGRGANFSRFGPGTEVVAFEPNVYFDEPLRAAARENGIVLDLRAHDLRSGGLPDESEDVVVSTLVLCSVEDVDAELEEIRRVLRPGGRFLFIEHVAAAPRSVRRLYQRVARGPIRILGDGCDACAQTDRALQRSGLTLADARLEVLGPRLDPTSLCYWGVATRE